MLRNYSSKIKVTQVLEPQAITADTASASIDCEAFGSAGFLVNVGTFTFTGTNKIALELLVSDDNSSFVNAAEADLYVSETAPASKILDTAGEGAACHFVEYRGNHRYVKLNLNVSGTVNVIVGVAALQGYPELMPPL